MALRLPLVIGSENVVGELPNGDTLPMSAIAGLTDGVYTPTPVGVTNVTSVTGAPTVWMRIGNTVMMTGRINVAPTATDTITTVDIPIPIPSQFTSNTNASGDGSIFNGSTGTLAAAIINSVTTNTIRTTFYSVATTTHQVRFSIAYPIMEAQSTDAPVYVQKTGAVSDGSQYKEGTFANPTTNGNAIIVTTGWSLYDEGDLLTYQIEVTDNMGNTYELIDSIASTSSSSGSKFATAIFIAKNIVGGSGHEIYVGHDNNLSPGFSAIEISGANTINPVADSSKVKDLASPYEAPPVDVDPMSFVVAAMTCGGAPTNFSVAGFTTINDYHVAGWWPTGSAYLRAPTGPSLSAEFVIPGGNTPGLVVAVIKP